MGPSLLRVCFSPLEDNSLVILEGEEQWDFMGASLSIENLQSTISQRIAKWALVRKEFSNIKLDGYFVQLTGLYDLWFGQGETDVWME